jgi:hypothetical protein
LITLTAIRPLFGFSKGREVSLFSVAQASSLISAFSVVFSALYGSFAPRVAALHRKQLLTYLRLANKRLGLPINFNVVLIKDGITRVVNVLEE